MKKIKFITLIILLFIGVNSFSQTKDYKVINKQWLLKGYKTPLKSYDYKVTSFDLLYLDLYTQKEKKISSNTGDITNDMIIIIKKSGRGAIIKLKNIKAIDEKGKAVKVNDITYKLD